MDSIWILLPWVFSPMNLGFLRMFLGLVKRSGSVSCLHLFIPVIYITVNLWNWAVNWYNGVLGDGKGWIRAKGDRNQSGRSLKKIMRSFSNIKTRYFENGRVIMAVHLQNDETVVSNWFLRSGKVSWDFGWFVIAEFPAIENPVVPTDLLEFDDLVLIENSEFSAISE